MPPFVSEIPGPEVRRVQRCVEPFSFGRSTVRFAPFFRVTFWPESASVRTVAEFAGLFADLVVVMVGAELCAVPQAAMQNAQASKAAFATTRFVPASFLGVFIVSFTLVVTSIRGSHLASPPPGVRIRIDEVRPGVDRDQG
jgi:hypothetical protein